MKVYSPNTLTSFLTLNDINFMGTYMGKSVLVEKVHAKLHPRTEQRIFRILTSKISITSLPAFTLLHCAKVLVSI